MKINNLLPSDNSVLQPLSTIPDPPKLLYSIGSLPKVRPMVVAVVGSRRPTAYGRAVTKDIAESLASRGVWIVSGMALGVDAIAHQAALNVNGHTIAVLPSGVDDPYPKSNLGLARAILKNGDALISEFESGHVPRPYDFLHRNRLVSGLADAIVVTEANLRSGTLSTVAHALAQGKDVYAVPGPITSPLSAGCNRLIAQGASPITDVTSFLEQLNLESSNKNVRGDTPSEQLIIDLLKSGLADGDELLEKTQLNAAEFSQTITLLEIKGKISALGGNQWRL